jgi:hypothetical protein
MFWRHCHSTSLRIGSGAIGLGCASCASLPALSRHRTGHEAGSPRVGLIPTELRTRGSDLSCRTALVSDIIAPLHIADDPMQQTGSDHLVAAKLRRNVLKKSIAIGCRYRFAACISKLNS